MKKKKKHKKDNDQYIISYIMKNTLYAPTNVSSYATDAKN